MNSRCRFTASALIILVLLVVPAPGQTPRGAVVDYTLSVKRPVSHIYDIEIEISGIRSASIDVAMPAWTPGDYRIRDFARNVQEFSAETTKNARLAWQQLDKQTWRVRKSAGDDLRIHYRIYSGDLTDELADITSAATFMYVVGNKQAPGPEVITRRSILFPIPEKARLHRSCSTWKFEDGRKTQKASMMS